jgi:GDP-L-fucose synthase
MYFHDAIYIISTGGEMISDKYKSVLVTGGTGFFGKNLVPFLVENGFTVKATGKDYDLIYFDQAENLFKEKKYDLIIHGAAFQGAGDFTLKYPADQMFKNNLIHANTMECWKRFQPQARMIGIGSTCSYPDKAILSEDDYFSGPLHESVEFYGLTKSMMQKSIKAYKKQYGLKGTTVVFATLYGPHDEFDISRSHVVSALVQKFCDAKNKNLSEVEVWGDGHQTRELIFVEDQIIGLMMTLEHDGDLLNIGTGIQTKIQDLAETIKKIVKYNGDITYNNNRFVGVRHKVLNIDKAKTIFGWTVKNKMHTLEEGLKKTVDWYEKNYI